MKMLLSVCGVMSLICLSAALPTPTSISQECEDHFHNCTYLALTGACAKTQEWMTEHCSVTCNSCQGKTKLPVCVDQHKNCPYWAFAGDCKKYTRYMLMNCKYSCNLCGGEDAQCQDQDEKCSFLARKGECLTNAPYMFVKCRKSCFMCGGISSACQDKQDNCAYLAYSGHCRSNQSHMLKVCEKSCTRCEGCLDRNKFCPEWAAKGENGIGMCEKNSPHYPYMRFYCQKSCKICSDIMSEE